MGEDARRRDHAVPLFKNEQSRRPVHRSTTVTRLHVAGLSDLATFLGLTPDPDWFEGAAQTIRSHDFLSVYRDEL